MDLERRAVDNGRTQIRCRRMVVVRHAVLRPPVTVLPGRAGYDTARDETVVVCVETSGEVECSVVPLGVLPQRRACRGGIREHLVTERLCIDCIHSRWLHPTESPVEIAERRGAVPIIVRNMRLVSVVRARVCVVVVLVRGGGGGGGGGGVSGLTHHST